MPKIKKDEKAEKKDVAQHRKRVEQQHHEDTHTWYPVYRSQGPQDSDCSYRRQIQIL
jgi:hypothetical protein